jgi:selenophosphate synthase
MARSSIVDAPYVYGQIAAANALSNVYAIGGRPPTVLAIACFPKSGVEPDTISQVFRGGFEADGSERRPARTVIKCTTRDQVRLRRNGCR